MIFAVIRSMFYSLTGDNPSTPVYFPESAVLRYANTAIARAASIADCCEARQTIQVTSGTGEYALASDCRRVYRATYDGDRLLPTMRLLLRQMSDNWDQVTGTPTHYYLDGLNSQIGLYKKPSASTVNATMTQEAGGIVASDAGDTMSQEAGEIVASDQTGDTFSQEAGFVAMAVESDAAEVFYIAEPAAMNGASDHMQLPMWSIPYVLFSMLSQAYGADTQLKNPKLSEFWGALAATVLVRLRNRTGDRGLSMFSVPAQRMRRGRAIVTYPTPITET
ncbi:MAG: hypothetical protein ABFE13_11345 [Phycisphaerales bacterium]